MVGVRARDKVMVRIRVIKLLGSNYTQPKIHPNPSHNRKLTLNLPRS